MKKFIGFLIVAGLLGGYIYFFDNSLLDLQKQEETQNELLYETFNAKHPHHIIIKNKEEEIDLQRSWEGDWTVVNADNYPADEAVINEMMEEVLTLTKDQLISNNPQNWNKFNVTSTTGIEVIFKEREDREIAHFWVGKMGTSYGTQYIRKNNLDEVYLVNKNLNQYFTKTLDDWKDHTILKLDAEKIQTVEVSDNYGLVRSGSGWTMNGENFEQEKVNVILNAVANLKTTEFPVDEIEVNAESADYIVLIKSEEEANILYFKKMEEDDDYYVILDGNSTLFKITKLTKEEIISAI